MKVVTIADNPTLRLLVMAILALCAAGSARAADDAFCAPFARRAVAQWGLAGTHPACWLKNGGDRWNGDYWTQLMRCGKQPEAQLRQEIDARDQHLHACGALKPNESFTQNMDGRHSAHSVAASSAWITLQGNWYWASGGGHQELTIQNYGYQISQHECRNQHFEEIDSAELPSGYVSRVVIETHVDEAAAPACRKMDRIIEFQMAPDGKCAATLSFYPSREAWAAGKPTRSGAFTFTCSQPPPCVERSIDASYGCQEPLHRAWGRTS